MSPPIPPSLEALRHQPFSFYPAILGIEHNEWRYRKATWSEVLVVNARTGLEIWIPRRFLGEISRIEDPVVIVGLVRELEYRSGAVWPHQRRVIEMPIAVGAAPPPAMRPQHTEPAPVVGIRLESKTDSQIFRLVGGALVLGIVAAYCVVNFYRGGAPRPRVTYSAKDQSYLDLNAGDDYRAVVRKLGPPTEDHWQSESGALQFRALSYADHSYTVILMGTNRHKASYIGTLDQNWNPLHTVEFAHGDGTDSLLRGLPRF